MGLSPRGARTLAAVFLATTLVLAGALVGTWRYIVPILREPVPAPPLVVQTQPAAGPASPLLVRYQLDLPGRGEIFPALASAADYWPVAILRITNTADRPVVQTVSAEVPGWSRRTELSIAVAGSETRSLRLEPELLPQAFENQEIRRATLQVHVSGPTGDTAYAQSRPVFLHSASDFYWGQKFANAQFIARWVTPHDPAVLRLVAEARRWAPGGRLRGYNQPHSSPKQLPTQVRMQAHAVFEALRRAGISYVSSIYTFGNFASDAQRVRLPSETLSLNSANCIDVSVAFASAMENLGLDPVIVIVPGHAFAGVRLAPDSAAILYLDLTVLPQGSFEQAEGRAVAWLKKTPANQVINVDVTAARLLGIYPMPSFAPETPIIASESPSRANQHGR